MRQIEVTLVPILQQVQQKIEHELLGKVTLDIYATIDYTYGMWTLFGMRVSEIKTFIESDAEEMQK